MKKFLHLIVPAFFIPATIIGAAHITRAQDPVEVDPDHYKVLYKNKTVRILEYKDSPGHKVPKHSHPNYFVYVISDATRLFTDWKSGKDCTGGAANTVILTAGTHLPPNPPPLKPPITHCEENTGTTDTHLIVVEFTDTPTRAGRSKSRRRH